MRHAPVRVGAGRPEAGWRFRARRPDRATMDWIADPGSLTARLVARAAGTFRVRVTRLVWARPTLAERRALALPRGEWALIREVVLEGQGEPWVIARSVIPRVTLTGRNRQLRALGNRPLGAFLFRDPTLRRTEVKVVQLGLPKALSSASAHTAWGRCSTFVLRGRPLLVAEYFLPALLTPRSAGVPT